MHYSTQCLQWSKSFGEDGKFNKKLTPTVQSFGIQESYKSNSKSDKVKRPLGPVGKSRQGATKESRTHA